MFDSFNTQSGVTIDAGGAACNSAGLAKLRSRRSRAVSHSAQGHILFVGDRVDQGAPIFMGWAPTGGADKLLKEARLSEPTAHVVDFTSATYGAYLMIAKHVKPHQWAGKWYQRTPAMMAFIKDILPTDAE